MSWELVRETLRYEGYTPDEIEAEIAKRKRLKAERKRDADQLKAQRQRERDAHAAAMAKEEEKLYPSDAGYKPKRIDSTLQGAGRATGKTAESIRKGRALTKYEHDK